MGNDSFRKGLDRGHTVAFLFETGINYRKNSQILSFSPPLPNSPTANPQISLAESSTNVIPLKLVSK